MPASKCTKEFARKHRATGADRRQLELPEEVVDAGQPAQIHGADPAVRSHPVHPRIVRALNAFWERAFLVLGVRAFSGEEGMRGEPMRGRARVSLCGRQ